MPSGSAAATSTACWSPSPADMTDNENVTVADLEPHGYIRALWFVGEPKRYLAPGGLRTVTEEEALKEIADTKRELGLT